MTIDAGQVADVNTARIAAVGAKRAASIAARLHAKGWTSGFSGNYRYTTDVQDDEITYVFVDCSRELASFHFVFERERGDQLHWLAGGAGNCNGRVGCRDSTDGRELQQAKAIYYRCKPTRSRRRSL